MKKLFIFSGAALAVIIAASLIFMHSANGKEELFDANIRAFGYADPVFLPCERVTTLEFCEYQEYIKDPESGEWKPWGDKKILNKARNISKNPS